MTEAQILCYLGYLNRKDIADFIPISALTAEPDSVMARASIHELYPRLTSKGTLPINGDFWTGYMLLSSIYEKLPPEYLRAIRKRFGSTTIGDYTDEYRRLYPAPAVQREIVTPVSNDDLRRLFNIPKTAEDSTSTASTTQSAVLDAWSIGKVIDTMSPSNRKRLGSGPESAAKRAKAENNEMLKKVNQQAEIIQEAIESLQEKQETKLQEMRQAIEENKQALSSMQGELRQFMSAVATTLRDIQERLDE